MDVRLSWDLLMDVGLGRDLLVDVWNNLWGSHGGGDHSEEHLQQQHSIQMVAAQMGHPSQFVEFKTGPGVPSELQSSV